MLGRVLRLILLGLSLHVSAAEAGSRWLVIAGSYPTVQPALKSKQSLRTFFPEAEVVASSDCSNVKPDLYLTVVTITKDTDSAKKVLAKVKERNTDSYLRECHPKPDSRILLSVPLVDASIEKVPEDAVNWTDEDRISKIVKLPDRGYLWIRRRYEAVPEDPREGRRESVLFFISSPEQSTQLEVDCTDPAFHQKGNRIALSCARETAADNLLHETKVYEAASGKELVTVPRCRRPKLESPAELICQAEEVGPQGKLRLRPKHLPLQ